MNVVGTDDYMRIGVYAEPHDVLDDLALIDLARDWATRGDLRVGVDEDQYLMWLEKGSDRVQLTPERLGPNTPEHEMVLTDHHLRELRRTMADLMHSISTSPGTNAHAPLGGSWQFVPDPMTEF
jgi:hypothetical protein